MTSPNPKRPRLGEILDEDSESSSEDECDACTVHVDQVAIWLLSGHWPDCFDTMETHLTKALGQERGAATMRLIISLSPIPLNGNALHWAFLQHAELGLAYLVLHPHRADFYQQHTHHRWTRKSAAQIVPCFAHVDPKVCYSNPSGVTASAI